MSQEEIARNFYKELKEKIVERSKQPFQFKGETVAPIHEEFLAILT